MSNHLEQTRALEVPQREAMLRREPSAQDFWTIHRDLLANAWKEWEAHEDTSAIELGSSLIDPRLREAVESAWQDPTTESAVRDLLHEAAPGVFAFQLLAPDRLDSLREYLEKVWDAGVPIRPPYGIVLNRRGGMLDRRSAGYLGAPRFQEVYQDLLDTYMRPISRLVFPEVSGYDTQTFGFSINYQPTTDTSIRPHSDASAVTLNINVNLPGEEFTGSEVDFLDTATEEVHSLTFEPGSAMIHRGHIPHAARPIVSGQRTNLVLWLFGDGGRVPTQRVAPRTQSAQERWTTPTDSYDDYAPF